MTQGVTFDGLAPTQTPEHAASFAELLQTALADEYTAGGRAALIDAATRRMATSRGVTADGLVDDATPNDFDDILDRWPPELWDDPHALGWLHEQHAAAARHDAFEAHVQREQKHSSQTVTTQLYTPRWIADVLASEAIAQCDGGAPALLDPAVGGGQMLLAAMSVFARRTPDAEPHQWVAPLWGVDLDERAVDVAQRTIALEVARVTGRRCERSEQICRRQITAGDGLNDADVQPADAVVTNPPYMGWRSMPDGLRERLDPRFRPYHRDLFSTFIARCHELAEQTVGILAQQSIWYLRRFEKARRDLLERAALTLFLHLGAGAFWNLDGEKASVVAFVQRTDGRCDGSEPAKLWDLRDETGPEDKRRAFEESLRCGEPTLFDVATTKPVPGRPICHDLEPELRALFDELPPLVEFADVPSQNKTGRNKTYVREWMDVPEDQLRRVEALGGRGKPQGRWVFYSKGGRFAPWWGNWKWVVDWSDEARRFYDENRTSSLLDEKWWFREGIVYTDFGGKRFNARWMPPNCLFDMTGPAVFPADHWWPTLTERERIGAALAVLNSSPARRMLKALNPTLHFQMRDVRALPVPQMEDETAREVAEDVWALIDGLRRIHATVEGDPLYDGAVEVGARQREELLGQLADLEVAIDQRVCEAYGVRYCPLEGASVKRHHLV